MNLLLIPLLLIGLLLAETRSRSLLRRLSQPFFSHRRLSYDLLGLSALALLLWPTTPPLPEPPQPGGGRLVLAVDVSASMRNPGGKQDGFATLRNELLDLVERLPPGEIALVPFAGRPVLQVPLTRDREALKFFLRHLEPGQVPDPGSDPLAAAYFAQQLLLRESGGADAVLLVSDGERTIPAAPPHLRQEIPVDVLPLPEMNPHPVLDRQGQPRRGPTGALLLSQPDPDLLASIARSSGGRLLDWSSSYPTAPIVQRWPQPQVTVGEDPPWLLWLALLLLLLRHLPWPGRFSVLPLTALVLLLVSCQQETDPLQQQLSQLQQEKDPVTAARGWLALAERSSGEVRTAALFNGGTLLLQRGETDAALPALQAALLRNPLGQDLRTNYILAQRQTPESAGSSGTEEKPAQKDQDQGAGQQLSGQEVLRAAPIRPYLPGRLEHRGEQEIKVERDW